MEIKVKDEMDDIRLKVSHKELVIIKEALELFYSSKKDVKTLNNKLFDKDEFKNERKIEIKIWRMFVKIHKKLENIHPY